MPITYANKNKNAAAGQPERTWRDVDANEVKTVVNAMDTGEINLKRDFGALGEGTDDTAAINAAIAAANLGTGAVGDGRKPIIMPPGDYGVSSQIVLSHEIMFVGLNRAHCRIVPLPGFPADTAVVKIGNSVTDYDHANGLRGISVQCNGVADYGVEIFNCNENGGLYDFEVKYWKKKGIIINGDRAINFGIRDGHIATLVASITNPMCMDVINMHHPINLQRLTLIPGTASGPAVDGIGIRCAASGYSMITVSDSHFEQAKWGVSAEAGRVHVENCDGLGNVQFLVNFSGSVIGTAERLMINSDGGSKCIRDATDAFVGSPLEFGDYVFMKKYAANRQRGTGAIWCLSTAVNTDSNGLATINHGMPGAPTIVVISSTNPDSTEMLYPKIRSVSSTQITIQIYDINGAAFESNRNGLTLSLVMEM